MSVSSDGWIESQTGQFGNIVQWDSEGVVLEGVFQGLHEGKYGMLVDVYTTEGLRSASATVMLDQKLSEIPVGSDIRITFIGYIETKTGRALKNFEVLFRPSKSKA